MRKIWIIRFSDGTIGSCYGTRSGATEIAELRKEDYIRKVYDKAQTVPDRSMESAEPYAG